MITTESQRTILNLKQIALEKTFVTDLPIALQQEIEAILKTIPAAANIQLSDGYTVGQLIKKIGLNIRIQA